MLMRLLTILALLMQPIPLTATPVVHHEDSGCPCHESVPAPSCHGSTHSDESESSKAPGCCPQDPGCTCVVSVPGDLPATPPLPESRSRDLVAISADVRPVAVLETERELQSLTPPEPPPPIQRAKARALLASWLI